VAPSDRDCRKDHSIASATSIATQALNSETSIWLEIVLDDQNLGKCVHVIHDASSTVQGRQAYHTLADVHCHRQDLRSFRRLLMIARDLQVVLEHSVSEIPNACAADMALPPFRPFD
jgi:hypothetical protein